MRIISGAFRGKRITAPAHLPVRPTTDFAKEALFNVLNNHYYFDEISVLDLCSGIGGISLEFLSRGSQKVVSVDLDTDCVKFLSEISQKMNLQDWHTVIRSDVFQFLNRNTQGGFDVIFVDPPYSFEQEDYLKIIDLIRENNWLNPDGELIVEHSKSIHLDEHPHLLQSRKYGSVHFSFFDFEKKE
ncbi:MAG: 16S rRNA (guanine(966)-N(2))-methyltransferase RsmD [Weeksellaceae bacterium]|nr:16S rRNA (guanine(966)-N(2))-methyltransferase RsmD [Weeksellaceae bacterium]